MPDQEGKLTQAEKDRIKQFLTRPQNDLRCPICGQVEWAIADHLVQPITIENQSLQLGGGVGYPVVMLISPSCGYTRYFNAVVLGLAPPSGPTQQGEAGNG